MNTNYCQVVEMTDEQKRKMYRKCTKEQLIGFIIELEKLKQNVLDHVYIDESIQSQRLKHYQDLGYTICTT